MVKYVCLNCNYRVDSENLSSCPYCGKENIEREKNASELLNEIERILD